MLLCFGREVGGSVTRLPLLQQTGLANLCTPEVQTLDSVPLAATVDEIFGLKSRRVVSYI